MSAIHVAAKEHFGDRPFTVIGDGTAIWNENGNPVSGQTLEAIRLRASQIESEQAVAETHAAINTERQRRIVAGKVIDGIYVTGRDEDARNLTNLALAAQMRIAGGDTATLTVFRDGDNVDHSLTPPQVLSLWQQSAAYVSALYEASWAIKAMDPLPEDVADDAPWPAT